MPVVIIDTSEEADRESLIEKINAYNNGILVLSDRAVISSEIFIEDEEILYSNLEIEDIESKEEIVDLLTIDTEKIYVAFAITIFIYLFTIYCISNIIDAVILGMLGYVFARIVGLRLKYKATFNIGIYSLTLPIILKLIYISINTMTGFVINYFGWMYTSISYIYVAVAILMIKAEIINQKIELMKLQAIQEKVVEEAVEEETKKEEKSEEEDKNEEKEQDDGEQPEGSNA